jgi:ADP-ribose pyrophosphatase YjhB (NUDIX family)
VRAPGGRHLHHGPGGRLLIVQQVQDGRPLWGPPVGGMEPGESIEEGALREALEETGLRVRLIRLISVDEFWHAGVFQGVGFNFLAEPNAWPQPVVIPDFGGTVAFLD